MPRFRYAALILGLAFFGADARANQPLPRVNGGWGERCDLALVPPWSTDLPERLNEFVLREGRLPEFSREGEDHLYERMKQAVKQGRGMARLFSSQAVELIRRETFYRNAFLALVGRTERKYLDEISVAEQRALQMFRAWGDDPFPMDLRREFEGLLVAQAERVGADGNLVLGGVNDVVSAAGRLPGHEESVPKRRLKYYLANFEPAILQLSPDARALVKATRQYRSRARELEEASESTSALSPLLRFQLALWRAFNE